MKNISMKNPQIIRFEYRPEPDDPEYKGCTWARFDVDETEKLLSITSDCGNYAYCYWDPGESSFLEFLSRLGRDYLCEKMLGAPTIINEALTVENIRDAYDEVEETISEDEYERLLSNLSDIKACNPSDLSSTIRCIEDWEDDNDISWIDDLQELITVDYTPQQKRIIRIFTDYIQPAMRKAIEIAKS